MKKFGTRTMVGGIINVARMSRKVASRPRNEYLLSAKAAIELINKVIKVATTVMKTLFQR